MEKKETSVWVAGSIMRFLKLIWYFLLDIIRPFRRPILYKIATIDLLFIIAMLIIGKIYTILPMTSYQESMKKILIVLIVSVIAVSAVYWLLKVLFYRLIRKSYRFFNSYLKQVVAIVIIYTIMNMIYYLIRTLIIKVIVIEYTDTIKYIVITIFALAAYTIFLLIQKHDNEKFWTMIKNSFHDLFTLKNYFFIFYDIVLLIPAYVLIQILTWAHQALLVYGQIDMNLLNNTFLYGTNVVVILMLALAMSVNKFHIFDLNNTLRMKSGEENSRQ